MKRSECTEKYNSKHRKLAFTIAVSFTYCTLILVVFWLTEGDILAVFVHTLDYFVFCIHYGVICVSQVLHNLGSIHNYL
jgi:hypothetical protein